MVFSNLIFLYIFLPLFILCYKFFNKNVIICLFSLIFYSFGEPTYVLLLIISIYFNYFIAKLIDKENHKKRYLIIGVSVNLLLLVVFKYTNFITSIIFNGDLEKFRTNIRLPIGISFYTFQAISYIVDVYRGKVTAQKKFMNVLLYISMFPQLIAGPIVRYKTIADKIENREITTLDKIYGLQRFIIGLAKKVILANQLSIISNSFLQNDLYRMSKVGLIAGIIVFLLQLYFDFSGYTDMAIGLGAIMGFKFEENFDFPFASKNMTEFWRRWHMSLGSFFKDYVYIPLGGNRHHQMRNIIIVWLLTGIWHGASLNFILWGIFLATFIIIEKIFLIDFLKKLPNFISHIYLCFITIISFTIFYFDDVLKLRDFFISLFTSNNIIDLYTKNTLLNNLFLIIVSIFFALPISEKLNLVLGYINENKNVGLAVRVIYILFLLLYSTILLIGNTSNPSNFKIEYFLLYGIYFIISAFFMFCKRTDVSEIENRNLSKFPTNVTLNSVLTGEYFKDIDTWFSDTVPFRDTILSLSYNLKRVKGLSTKIDFTNYTFKNNYNEEIEGTTKKASESNIEDKNLYVLDASEEIIVDETKNEESVENTESLVIEETTSEVNNESDYYKKSS